MLNNISAKNYILASLVLLGLFALALNFMGQIWICKCGYVKFWHGITYSSENSQHLTDWYTFSHIIHGFIFYWIAWLVGKRYGWPIGFRLLLALLAEISWELFENTDFVINRYREVTISLDYYGDTVINSVMDVLAMVFGFFLAYRLPVWSIVALTIAMEIFVGYTIRDNLTLNIIMLIFPLDFILKWQSG
ncbi:DUF2585 domain-containing protein [Candidatus Giovannonibacteria bacterium]|nr:DUF2585 domain-containing protein [Candidatus Giovannonibacteria bacterium]